MNFFNMFKKITIFVIFFSVCHQLYHMFLLLKQEDKDCCPCMQLKMFQVTLDKANCCQCPNGFHLNFKIIDFVVETIYDLSSLFCTMIFLSAFGYSFYLVSTNTLRSLRNFLIVFTSIALIGYCKTNGYDGGYTKFIGTNTLHNMCQFQCNWYDSRKFQYTCSANCVNKYMTKDYLNSINAVRNTNEKIVKNYRESLKQTKHSINYFSKIFYNGFDYISVSCYKVGNYLDNCYNSIFEYCFDLYEKLYSKIFV